MNLNTNPYLDDFILFLEKCHLLTPMQFAKLKYFLKFKKRLNLKSPRDHNEKVQWLKFYSDTSEWPRLADKYAVRSYVKERGLEDMLVPLYGVYNCAEDIEFDKFPNSFVMKTNNGCATNIIVKDKNLLDKTATVRQLNKWLKTRFGVLTIEPHYLKIPPKVIIEELLVNDSGFSSSLVDYKFHCTNGIARFLEIHYDRDEWGSKVMLYDTSFNPLKDFVSKSDIDFSIIKKPTSLDHMIEACMALGKQFPLLRIDFYEVGGKPYIGEMTFTNASGLDDDFTQEFRNLLGSYIHLKRK